MLALLKRLLRPLLIVLGLVLLAAFIWWAGPYFEFADYRPLESATARLVAIAFVIVCWIAVALIRRWRASRAGDKLAAVITQQPEPAPVSAEAVKLRERFEEAVAELKQRRGSGHSLYDLPWYVIIGAPGSGKTTALLNSGFKFPLEHHVGKAALRGVGGTRNCDWWFTDEAVFLDTAGRYTTQDSDAASDSAAWAEFLTLLRKYRARRPVNGVILTINAEDLIVRGDSARDAHVEAVRRRLSELNRQLRIELPVYVVVTKCDLVAGFVEYFDDLTQEGRAQVWGVTFTYDQTVNGEAAARFPAEYDALMTRLNERLLERLEEAREVRRRARIFSFPQQMAALRDALATFVTDVFASTRFDVPILLRGVYLTSGTQDGTPVDRLLGGIGRRFGMASDAIPAASGPGKAYFVERLLRDVLVAESGLAGVNQRVEARKAATQLGAYAAVGIIAVAGVVLLTASYGRNRAYLAQADADVQAIDRLPRVAGGASLNALLPRLDAIRKVVNSAERHDDETSWLLRWGLHQGGSVGNSARDAYVRELNGSLLPQLAARIRERLIEHSSDLETLYKYLKAYLMLGDPQHLDKKYLGELTGLELNAPRAGEAGAALSKHFQWLLEYRRTLRPIPIDSSLTAQALNAIRNVSIPRLMYDRIKRAYADDRKRAVRLDLASLQSDKVFRRKSASLSEPLSSLYSRDVFKEVTTQHLSSMIKQFFAEDAWMHAGRAPSIRNPDELAASVTSLYEQDYIAVWDGILNDIELVPFSTLSQTTEVLKQLASQGSPMRSLLMLVADNTTLIEAPPPDPSGAAAAAKKLNDGLDAVKRAAEGTKSTSVARGALVTAHFQPIHQFLAGPPNSPLDQALGLIGQIHQHLDAIGARVGGADSATVLLGKTFRDPMKLLEEKAASAPPSIGVWLRQIVKGSERVLTVDATREIKDRFRQEVLEECQRAINGRYPFARQSGTEVAIEDFGRIFGYKGVFDRFFSDTLSQQVDASEHGWNWLPGSVNLPKSFLEPFIQAQIVREMFFVQGSQSPALSFYVTPTNLDPSSSRFFLEINGTKTHLKSREKPATWTIDWPGKNADGGALAAFESEKYPSAKVFERGGHWAWLHLIDEYAQTAPDARKRVILDIQNQYRNSVQVIVEPKSPAMNPFSGRDWRQFKCES